MISKYISHAALQFKKDLENAIITGINVKGENVGGLAAKESWIRSSRLINYFHEAIKFELMDNKIDPKRILPPIGASSPELNLAGFLKKKDQDVAVIPTSVNKTERQINWGPLQFEEAMDSNGQEFSEKSLVINVRSQMSSLAKNADTLFERTFAEPLNLHLVYPKLVLGEVYIIPLKEYDESQMNSNKISFKSKNINISKYVSFFNAINGRQNDTKDFHKYERCALLIIDFSLEVPKIYTKTQELVDDGFISEKSKVDLDNISVESFTKDILSIYTKRF